MKLPWNLRSKHPVLLVAGLGGLFTIVNLSSAQDWTIPSTPSLAQGWRTVVCSADGMRVLAGGGLRVDWYDWHGTNGSGTIGGVVPDYVPIFAPLWISMDAGTTWLETGLSGYDVCWKAVASSADGTKLVAAMLNVDVNDRGDGLSHGPGPIYSSFDSGRTWMATTAPSNSWASVASSADGVKLFAAAYGGEIFISSDSGTTWLQSAAPTSLGWSCIACSGDGLKLAASASGGPIYVSSDSGASWTQTSAPTNQWASDASSAEGTSLVAAANGFYDRSNNWRGGLIYISTDSGATWTSTSAPSNGWQSVACSADGTRLMAIGTTGTYISDNSGLVWTQTNPIGAASVATSADGNMVFLAGERIYTSLYLGLWKMGNAPAAFWQAPWQALASSANGTKLAAAVHGGPIYTSADSGATWAQTTAPSNYWESIASSADGTKLIAAVRWTPGVSNTSLGGPIYKSTDAGASWTQTSAPTNYWASIASSADGSKLVAAVWGTYGFSNNLLGGPIYVSADSGATWTRTGAPSNEWASVASSADGTKLVAAAYINVDSSNNWRRGSIFISPDAGATWTPTSAPSNRWASVASSADGAKFIALAYSGPDDPWPYGRIYLSADSGTTWTEANLPTNYWVSVSSSNDGRTLVAVGYVSDQVCWVDVMIGPPYQSHIYVSNDSGLTWSETAAPSESWRAVVCSGDGNRLNAAADNGPIYTLQLPVQPPPPPPTRRLDIRSPSDQLQISWVIPSSPFVLQESADLRTADWTDVPTSLTLNLTNLHHEVTLASPADNRFYRLKQR